MLEPTRAVTLNGSGDAPLGHDLYRMVRAAMPADWTHGERVVALLLADMCNDRTRRPPPGMNVTGQLLLETGAAAGTLGNILASLARKGCEVRRSIGTDKHGQPVYAAKGHALDYEFPLLAPRGAEGPLWSGPSSAKVHSPVEQTAKGPLLDGPLTPELHKPDPRPKGEPDQALVVPVITTSVEDAPANLDARLSKYIPESEAS